MKFEFDFRASDSPLVESVWYTQSERTDSFISAAASHWEMVVWKEDGETRITMRGPETTASPAQSDKDMEFFGIVFKLGTFMPQLPVGQLINTQLILPAASSRSFWLQGQSWEFPTFNNADTFIQRLVKAGMLVHEPVVDALLNDEPTYLSTRAVQYRFLRATGLTYNTVRQIERARKASQLLEQGTSILDTVHDLGYFDQAHLTRSLKRYMGQTPTQILRVGQPV